MDHPNRNPWEVADDPSLTTPKTSADALRALDHAHQQIVAGEVAELIAITSAADLWEVDKTVVAEGMERLLTPGHDGTPSVGEFLALEIGPLLGISATSALARIGEALDLRTRHPRLWDAVICGKARVWQATRICLECAHLPLEAVLKVDHAIGGSVGMLPFSRVMSALPGQITAADTDLARRRAEAQRESRHIRVSKIENGSVGIWGIVNPVDGIRFDHVLTEVAKTLPTQSDTPPSNDLDRRRAAAFGIIAQDAFRKLHSEQPLLDLSPLDAPELATPPASNPMLCTLVVHMSADDPAVAPTSDAATGVARVEGWGPLLTQQLPEFLRGAKVSVRPIIDPAGIRPVDAYETPAKMRFAIEQRNPVDVFPYGTAKAGRCDMDHTVPYQSGRPAQTHPGNLGPLSRRAHRAKTHSKWELEQPRPGVFCWTSPHGYQYVVSAAGTTRITAPEVALSAVAV